MEHQAPIRLFIEPFLRELQRELGYTMDIGKLKLFIAWAQGFDWQGEPDQLHRAYSVCKLLFLQDVQHEAKFSAAFLRYVYDELAWRYEFARQEGQQEEAKEEETITDDMGGQTEAPKIVDEKPKVEAEKPAAPEEHIMEPEPPDEEPAPQALDGKKYLHLQLYPTLPDVREQMDKGKSVASSRFLLTDDYMPLTYREMAQSWRYLRQKDEFRPGRQLDVEATVRHFAEEGMLLRPVFHEEALNSEDLLLILADRRGSMTPFHRLTDRLIEAARKEGGHRRAKVFYFYNCPVGYVYRQPNLTEPVPLAEVWHGIRPDRTNALVISDAGAARGNFNELRLQKTLEFLYDEKNGGANSLHKRALFVAWLNPMPRHRWTDSTAAAIAKDPGTPMFPLMELGKAGLLQAVHALAGKQ